VLQSVTTYAIEVERDTYQLGVVAKIANSSDEAEVLDSVSFDGASLDIAARGSAYIQEIHRPIAQAELTQSQLLKPGDVEHVKLLLPFRIRMLAKPPLAEFVVWGRWRIEVKRDLLRRSNVDLVPEFVGSGEDPLGVQEWALKSGALLAEAHPVTHRLLGIRFEKSTPVESLLLFNADRSAPLNLYGYDCTNRAVSGAGALIWIRGHGRPSLPAGWTVLGTSYPGVWADPDRLAVYNAIVSPDDLGRPRPFAAFFGLEAEMGVTESVPTTRGRDILNIKLLDRSEYDSERPVFLRFIAGGVEYVREKR
jgi:hypothetical protein